MELTDYKSTDFSRLEILKNDLNHANRDRKDFMTRFVDFSIKNSSKKVSVNPNKVIAVEQSENGSSILLEYGKFYELDADYEITTAHLIHETASEKRFSGKCNLD